ncbi:MAG: TonB family protein [Bacteroidota bacterium]
MFNSMQKNISLLSSVAFHTLLIFSFYFITLYSGGNSTILEKFNAESGSSVVEVGIIESKEKISLDEQPKEDFIKDEEKIIETKKEIIADKKAILSTRGNISDSSDVRGKGSGNGLSLGLPAPPKPAEEEIYLAAVEEMPEPIGGVEKIISRLVYPAEAKQKGISGTVFVLAYVDESGTVRKTLLTKGIGGGCDEAAMNAVATSKFKPGKDKGRYVKVQVQIPVVFRLP